MLSKYSIRWFLRDTRHVSYCVRSNVFRAITNQYKDHNESDTELVQHGADFLGSDGTVQHARRRAWSDGLGEIVCENQISDRTSNLSKRDSRQCNKKENNDFSGSKIETEKRISLNNDNNHICNSFKIRDLQISKIGPLFGRTCLSKTHFMRHFHTSTSCNKVNEATSEEISNNTTKEVSEEINGTKAEEKEKTASHSLRGKCVETNFHASSGQKEINFKNEVSESYHDEEGGEIDKLAETKNYPASVVKISESEDRIPENYGFQEMSVWEEILREKEHLELDIPEKVEENPIFPALPVIKPQGDITTDETGLTEYQPDRERKVAFPTKIYNLAPLVNQSVTLRELVKLGVDLSEVEKTSVADKIIKMDFKRDIKPYLLFLHDLGVSHDDFGKVLTKTPYLFQEDIETLKVRVNYFKSKKFKKENIASMVSKNAKFLLMSTERIDAKLGFYQRCFKLNGSEVRQLAVHSPKNLIIHEDWTKKSKFRLSEYLGFTELELKKMLLNYPKLFNIWPFERVEEIFDILHHKMDIPHSLMVVWPKVFDSSPLMLEQRHRFLLKVDRAQYDPKKENYVSLKSLVTTKDDMFCVDIAHASLAEFYNFLKSI